MSQQEDDLRALAKIMDFLRAVSIILVVAHLYWYCYEAIKLWGLNIGVVDRILMNFHRTAGLFGNMLYTKLFALVLMGLSCLGTKGMKEEHITWSKIWAFMGAGFVFFLPQLVDTCLATAHRGEYGSLYFYDNRRLCLSADGGTLYEPTLEEQPDGGCLQSRE